MNKNQIIQARYLEILKMIEDPNCEENKIKLISNFIDMINDIYDQPEIGLDSITRKMYSSNSEATASL